jgi:branched-chain amino acid aminotransferase
VRGYWNESKKELYVFRLREHAARLVYSQRAMRFAEIVDEDTIIRTTLEVLRANQFREPVHIRPTVYVDGHGSPGARGPIGFAVTAIPMAIPARVEKGCSAQVSSWQRISDRAMPARVKANANYNNSRFATIQSETDGYDAAIMLNSHGHVAEGPGMCLFIIRDGVPVTPGVANDILESITRDAILKIFADHLGREPVERDVDRSELYAAQEAFFCGTAWEVTPVTSVDRVPVGTGEVGPITRQLQAIYVDVAHARRSEYPEWRLPVYGNAGP